MKKKYFVSRTMAIVLFFLWSTSYSNGTQKGIVIVPVADLVGQPMHSYYRHQPAHTSYNTLPWACHKSDYEASPRVHQLLYHEIVDIIAYEKDEVQVQVPHFFYQTTTNQIPQNSYWTLKKNIMPSNLLRLNTNDRSKIPTPLSFDIKSEMPHYNTITLIEPFTDPTLNITFSAGTRFIKNDNQKDTQMISAYCLDPHNYTINHIALPRAITHIFYPKTIQDRLTDFLKILRHWAQKPASIPYLLGGCSFIDVCSSDNFRLQKKAIRGKSLQYYVRSSDTYAPKTGYDCSSMITRAAQIVGLPYYCKNTYTIAQKLPPLTFQDSLKEGDLIWISGHVLIVSDLKKNKVIEAHAYGGGYGKIHEIAIAKVFQGIDTLAQLTSRYHEKKPVKRLTKHNAILDTYKEVRLFKFAGQWI